MLSLDGGEREDSPQFEFFVLFWGGMYFLFIKNPPKIEN